MKKIKRGLLTLGVRQPLYMPNLLITRIVTGPCSVQRNPLPTNYRRIISGKRRSDKASEHLTNLKSYIDAVVDVAFSSVSLPTHRARSPSTILQQQPSIRQDAMLLSC